MLTSICLFLLYLTWGLLSFLSQGNDRLRKRFKSLDPLGLIPNYRFFCPDPIRTDYHLYYRLRATDSQVGDWREITIGKRSRVFGFLWNPLKRDRKIFYKTVKVLRTGGKRKEQENTYLALLQWVGEKNTRSGAEAVQFRITSKQDFAREGPEREVHLSGFHLINPRDAYVLPA